MNKTLKQEMRKEMWEDLAYFDKLGIIYHSVNLYTESYIDKEGNTKLKKIYTPNWIQHSKITKTSFNKKLNGTIVPMGKKINTSLGEAKLIGIDIDNKEKSIKNWKNFVKEVKDEELDHTLIIKTMNGGYHYYYVIMEDQIEELEKINFKQQNNAIFKDKGIIIDIKYDSGMLFGPSVVPVDESWKNYKIISKIHPSKLPHIIFNEIIKNYSKDKTKENKIKSIIQPKIEEIKEKKLNQNTVIIEENDEDERLRWYLDCLPLDTWENYETWFKFGGGIYKNGGSINLFIAYSATAPNFNKKSCIEMWENYKKNKNKCIDMKVIKYYAKKNDLKRYKIATKKDMDTILLKIMQEGITDKTAAELFYNYYQDKFFYDEINKCWYVLNEYNIWKKDSEGYEIINYILNSLPKLINNFYTKIINQNRLSDEERNKYSKNWSKSIKYVSMIKSKKCIAEELICFYKNDKIYENLDNVNNNLFAFDNGVWDLKENCFRLPKEEEYISTTCGYDYFPKNKKINETINDLHNIFQSMFRDEEEKDYLLFTIADCLNGNRSNEKFHLWRGQGRNGKGVTRDLIKQTFGEYFDNMEIDYLNKTKHGQSATSADEVMARKKNARIVISTEPESDMELKINKIKQWSGGDPVQCRFNYGHSFNYKPKFKLFIQSNHDITFGGQNCTAVLERLEVQEFPFCFTNNPNKEYEKLIDKNLKERISENTYKIAFFHILLEYYNKYIENNKEIKIPDSVKEQTEIFFATSNPFESFYEDVIEYVKDTTQYESSSDLMKAFKKYHQNNDVSMNTQEFKSALINKGNKPSVLKGRVIWRGLKINQHKLTNSIDPDNIDFIDI